MRILDGKRVISARLTQVAIILLLLAWGNGRANGQTETILYQFGSTSGDGQNPYAGLTQGADGNFYGTTYHGGTRGCGTVFQISPSGVYTSLYSFESNHPDGCASRNQLVQGSDGNFYGTTYDSTVFRISAGGNETNLFSLISSPANGNDPNSLVQGNDGNFYGTSDHGGTNTSCPPYPGCGNVFRFSAGGNATNLYSFVGSPTNGFDPICALVQGIDGNFYGTTDQGGQYGGGTIFRISSNGTFTNLHSFSSSDGGFPSTALTQGSDGDFYGTTADGGASNNGTIFRISPSGSYTALYSFAGISYGGFPVGALVQGSDGNFYGATPYGGVSTNCSEGCGTVFRISPSGVYTTLYSFAGPPNDGGSPNGIIQGIDGNFYGTTSQGGTNSYGIVFKLSVPLNPPIEIPQPAPYTNDDYTVLLEHFDNSTSGSVNGSVSYDTGVYGQGIRLTDTSYVTWNLGTLPQGTVEFWLKLDSLTNSNPSSGINMAGSYFSGIPEAITMSMFVNETPPTNLVTAGINNSSLNWVWLPASGLVTANHTRHTRCGI